MPVFWISCITFNRWCECIIAWGIAGLRDFGITHARIPRGHPHRIGRRGQTHQTGEASSYGSLEEARLTMLAQRMVAWNGNTTLVAHTSTAEADASRSPDRGGEGKDHVCSSGRELGRSPNARSPVNQNSAAQSAETSRVQQLERDSERPALRPARPAR